MEVPIDAFVHHFFFLQELITNENRPKATKISQIIQGYETQSFKSNFESWPLGTGTGNSGGEEGRGKVAGTKCKLITGFSGPFVFDFFL